MSSRPLRRNRDFVLLQAGQVLSTIGSESAAIAYPLVALAITHSPAKAGVVGFGRILPWADLLGGLAPLQRDREREPVDPQRAEPRRAGGTA